MEINFKVATIKDFLKVKEFILGKMEQSFKVLLKMVFAQEKVF